MLSAYETKVSMEPTKIEVKTKEPIDHTPNGDWGSRSAARVASTLHSYLSRRFGCGDSLPLGGLEVVRDGS